MRYLENPDTSESPSPQDACSDHTLHLLSPSLFKGVARHKGGCFCDRLDRLSLSCRYAASMAAECTL